MIYLDHHELLEVNDQSARGKKRKQNSNDLHEFKVFLKLRLNEKQNFSESSEKSLLISKC